MCFFKYIRTFYWYRYLYQIFFKECMFKEIFLKPDHNPDLVHSQLQITHSVLVHFQKQDPDSFQLS
jgi:hypothetical protein